MNQATVPITDNLKTKASTSVFTDGHVSRAYFSVTLFSTVPFITLAAYLDFPMMGVLEFFYVWEIEDKKKVNSRFI